jgi:ABC-type Zn uptake system ZnuABC Zn-binding protein ZnuA
VQDGTVKYIFMLDNQSETDTVKELVSAGAEVVYLRSMTIRTEDDVQNNVTYKTMMRENIDAIKKEVYES